MSQGLVICPNCQTQGRNQILGSVDSNGRFIIKRHARDGITIIEGSEYKIVCYCGFGTVVQNLANGKPDGNKFNQPAPTNTT